MPKQTFFNLPEDKRETFIQIAIDEFADHDYQSASISRIVARAGIAKGSFYQYFSDKKELYLYLLELGSQEKAALLQQFQPPDPQMDIFAYLRWLFSMQAEFELRHPRLAEVGYRAFFQDKPFYHEQLEQTRAAGEMFYRQLIEQGIASGSIDPTIDPEMATFIFLTLSAELGRYMTKRLEIDPQRMLERKLTQEDYQRMNAMFDDFIAILQHGMGRRDNIKATGTAGTQREQGEQEQ